MPARADRLTSLGTSAPSFFLRPNIVYLPPTRRMSVVEAWQTIDELLRDVNDLPRGRRH